MLLLIILTTGISAIMNVRAGDASAVIETLSKYAAGMQRMDISEMEKYVVTSDAFTVFEGVNIDSGWSNFRDKHLGPEFKEILKLEYSYSDIKPHILGEMAYATLRLKVAVKTDKRDASGEGLATAILTKHNGNWKIRHMHTSTSRKPKH